MVEITDSKSPVARQELLKLQADLGVSFPSDYADFLLSHNGGRVSPAIFWFSAKNNRRGRSRIRRLLSIYDGEHNNFLEYFRNYCGIRMPKEFFPIANEEGGNLVVISSEDGHVYFWDHEREQEDPGIENLSLIAESFTEFLDKLE